MVIPKEIIEKWKVLKSKEDVTAIAVLHDISPNTVYKVFKTGQCSYTVFEKIASFYAERENLLSQYMD